MRESSFLSNLFVKVKNKKSNKQTKNNKKYCLQLMPTDIDQQLQTFVSVRGSFTSWTTLFIAHDSFIIVN